MPSVPDYQILKEIGFFLAVYGIAGFFWWKVRRKKSGSERDRSSP